MDNLHITHLLLQTASKPSTAHIHFQQTGYYIKILDLYHKFIENKIHMYLFTATTILDMGSNRMVKDFIFSKSNMRVWG